jgi:cobalt-zinc-cadmium efflux system outer membrane protein
MVGNRLRLPGRCVVLLAGTILTASSGASQAPPRSPLTLIELLERVRTQYPGVGAADSRVDVASGARRSSGVFPNPVLGLNLENATLPGHSATAGMDRETMATATLPLEFVYQRGARVRRAGAELEAARAEGTSARQRIAMDAAHAYYRAALAQVEVAVAQDLVAWLDSLVSYNQNRVAQGVLGESDLLRAELERDRALAELTLQQTVSIDARAELSVLSGDSAALRPGLGLVWTPEAPLPLPAYGHGPHAELQAAQARLSAAGAGVGVAHSLLIRDLSAMAGLKRSAGSTTLLAGFSVPLPLVDQNRGDIARANAERSVAAFELSAMERHVLAELDAAFENSRLFAARVDAMRGPQDSLLDRQAARVQYLARADEVRRITYGAFQEGAAPLLSVLDAARTWGEARITYYRTLYAQHESVIALLAAEGRDLFTEIPLVLVAAKETPR